MSSTEASDPIPSRSGRKSQRSRACDMCRRRKVRCDGSVAEDRVCTNCVAFKFKCTYVQSAPQRVLDTRYIACLEEQLTEMRSLLAQYRQLYPNGEPSPLVSPSIFSTIPAEASPASPLERPDISDAIDISMPMSTAPIAKPVFSLSTIPTPTLADEEPDFDPSDDEVSTSKAMMTPFARSPLFPGNNSFQGKSSSMMMVSAALHSKREYIKGRAKKPKKMFRIPRDDEMDIRDSAGPKKRKEKEEDDVQVKNAPWCPATRADAWSDYPWILRTINRPQTQLEFPPPDLLEQLLSIYFSDLNSFIPLLHRPTFMKSVQDGLHKSDEGFGIVLLLVCALAAKRCNDPRVLLEEEIRKNNCIQYGNVEGVGENHKTYHSAGWFWFEQVRMSRFGISFQPTTLYQMQAAYLIASYTWETSMAWHGAGYGIRVAQMMGAHRKKSYSTEPTVEGELRKRAFWALILHDRSHSSIFGRACSIQDEDFDLDLPIVCDDEYWEQSDPGQDFQQPEGKPSKVAYFNCMLRLSQIHAYTLRTIYSINKSKALLGLVGHDWQRRIVSQIDSALNRWLDSVPLHLQWDSQVKSDLFYNQSANLHAAYYTLRIIVHRPFIRSPHNPSISSSPSLLVCTDAARSCINLLHEQFTRTGHVHDQYALFTSAIAILLNIWAGRKSMTPLETEVEMQRVHKVMDIVQTLEPWGHGSAKIWDTLSNLIKMGERPTHTLEESGPISKRARNEQIPSSDFQNAPLAERELTGSYEYQEQSRLQESHVRTETSGRTGGNGSAISAGSDLRPVIDYSSTAMAPSFMAAPAHEQSQYDSTHAPIDPVIQALLSMLSPAQYQQPQSSPAMGEMSPSSHGVQGGTAWNHDILAAEMNSGIPRTMGAASDLHSPQTTVPGGIPEWDPSSTWTSAPSGFGWEDWGAYLTNFREDNGQPSDNRSGNAEYPH